MNILDIKDKLESLKGQLYNNIREDDGLMPLLIRVEGDDVDPIPFIINDEKDRQNIPSFLEQQAENADYVILIMDMAISEKDLNFIIMFLYSKEDTLIKEISYGKSSDGEYVFSDFGWVDNYKTHFARIKNDIYGNPFQS